MVLRQQPKDLIVDRAECGLNVVLPVFRCLSLLCISSNCSIIRNISGKQVLKYIIAES